ncbi:hypothetical protein D9M71_808290 [compost metagenome]
MRPEVDFRDQYQRLLAGLQGFADQLQINFGFAAAGNTGEKERVVTVEPGANGFIGCPLFRVEWQFGLGQPVFVSGTGGVPADFDLDQFLGQQQIEAVLA